MSPYLEYRVAQRRLSAQRTRAFSIAETFVCIVLVSGLLVAALNTVGATAQGHALMSAQGKGQLLAADLMSEILTKAYEEPSGPSMFGPEVAEPTTSRAAFDDVDDYHNWNEIPPQKADGTALPDLAGWRRTVTIVRVNPDNPSAVSMTDQGAKRITVEVLFQGRQVASLVACRTGEPPAFQFHEPMELLD